MDENIFLNSEKSREELIQEIIERGRKIEKQEKRIRDLEQQLGKKNSLDEHKQFMLLERLAKLKVRPKTPGRKVGHPGVTRKKPTQIDRVVEQTLKQCPDCYQKLSKSQAVEDHIQEDLIPARPQATCFKKHRYYCKQCKKVVTAPYAEDEIPSGYVGPNVLIQTLILKYHHGLPFDKIADVFQGLNGFKISGGALSQALVRISEWLRVEEAEILSGIPSESPDSYG